MNERHCLLYVIEKPLYGFKTSGNCVLFSDTMFVSLFFHFWNEHKFGLNFNQCALAFIRENIRSYRIYYGRYYVWAWFYQCEIYISKKNRLFAEIIMGRGERRFKYFLFDYYCYHCLNIFSTFTYNLKTA